jgi:fatty acid-binding protein DegV
MARVVTDSCSDLSPELTQRFGIAAVPLYVNSADETYRDNVDLTTEEFYHRLAQSKAIPTTSAPSPGILAEFFQISQRNRRISSYYAFQNV